MKRFITFSLILTTTLLCAKSFGDKNFAPANNPLYQKECASCHFAYQPALLPKTSWQGDVVPHRRREKGFNGVSHPWI